MMVDWRGLRGGAGYPERFDCSVSAPTLLHIASVSLSLFYSLLLLFPIQPEMLLSLPRYLNSGFPRDTSSVVITFVTAPERVPTP